MRVFFLVLLFCVVAWSLEERNKNLKCIAKHGIDNCKEGKEK